MNSLWTYLGIGLCVLFCCLGVGGCSYLLNKGFAERELQKLQHERKP